MRDKRKVKKVIGTVLAAAVLLGTAFGTSTLYYKVKCNDC